MNTKATKIKKKKLLTTAVTLEQLVKQGDVAEHENLDLKPNPQTKDK